MDTTISFPTGPIQWLDQPISLKDFSAKHQVPNIIKVTKGQYRNIGVSKSVHSELYLHSVETTNKVLAEALRMKDGKTKMIVSEQKYSLPMSYKGWFELLSQDGKSVKAIQNVQELARFFPPTCLVRENMKAFVTNGGTDLSLERTRTVAAGEALTLNGEVWVPFPMGRSMGKRRVLKCTDTKGNTLFFGLEQKGIFSPIAGQTNISGVHSIKGVLDKFRLPVLVRLVHGVIPSKMDKGFNGIFRLMNVYSDENAFVCPLKRDAKMVPLSTQEPLKVTPAQDYKVFSQMEDIQMLQKKFVDMMESYMNSIHILISMPDESSFKNGELKSPNMPDSTPKSAKTARTISQEEEEILFQELDGIYQYVREGGLPPKPLTRPLNPPPNKQPSPFDKIATPKSPPPVPEKSGFGDIILETDDDPLMEIKMQHLDILEDDDDDEEEAGQVLKRQESYWEEPIYQPLDKIRKQKMKKQDAKKSSDEKLPTLVSGFDTPPESAYMEENDPKEVKSTPTTPDTAVPVANLRQVMRSLSTTPETSRPGALPLKVSPDEIMMPPPLPPKRFSGELLSPEAPKQVQVSPSNGKVKSQKKRSAGLMPNNRKSVSPPKQAMQSPFGNNSYNTSSSSGSSNSVQQLDRQPPNSSGMTIHPPYVAVARVRDYQQNPATASVNVNPEIYKPRYELNGTKVHSIYR